MGAECNKCGNDLHFGDPCQLCDLKKQLTDLQAQTDDLEDIVHEYRDHLFEQRQLGAGLSVMNKERKVKQALKSYREFKREL